MKTIIGVVLVVSLAFAALDPAISASVSILSLKNMIHGLTPLIVPSVLTTDTVLLDNVTVGNSLGSITVNNMTLKNQIDFMHTKIDFGIKNETSLRLSMTNLTADLVFDYVLHIIGDFSGTGDVGVRDLSFSITATLNKEGQVWDLVLEQQNISLPDLEIDLTPSTENFIVNLLKGRLETELLTVLPNTVLPLFNQKLKDFATIPNWGSIFLDDEYFLNLTLSDAPTLNADLGYAEAMMNGLVFSNKTKKTTAVHDLTPASRDLKAQSWQVYISDNTLTSILPALVNKYKVSTLSLPIPDADKGLLYMIFPGVQSHYSETEKFTVNVDLNDMSPVVTISEGKAKLEKFHVNADLKDSKGNNFAVIGLDLAVALKAELNSQHKIIIGFDEATIEQNSLQITDMFDLGRNVKSTELLLDSLLRAGQRTITQMFQSFQIASLLPQQYQYALFLFKNMELSLEKEHFLKLGFSYSLDP